MTDITQNITAPDRYLLRTTRRIGMLSYKSARVRFDHRTTVQGISFPSIFTLIDTELTKTFTQFYLSDGNQSLSIAGRVVAEFPDTITTGSPPWAEVLISIQAVGRYWNRESGEWEVDFYANRFPMTDTEGAVGEETDIKFEANINVETGLIPDLPGDEIEIIFYIARSTNTDPVVISNYTDFKNFELTLNNPAVEEGQNTAIDYMLTQQSAARGRYDDGSVWFSDGPTAYARSAITRDADGQELTSAWRFSDEASPIVHANILLREVMDMKRTQVRGLTSDLLGEYKPCKMPNIDDFFHFFIGGNQNGKDNKWAANLFRLNRVTDQTLSNGKYVTSNYTIDNDVVFRYRDIDGSLIAQQSGSVAWGAYYGLEWLAEDKFVYCDGNGRIAVLDVSPDTGDIIRTQLGNFAGGASDLDLDELGNIYTAHNAGLEGARKTSIDGETSIAQGLNQRKAYVDDAHVYTNHTQTGSIEKRSRETLDIVATSVEFSMSDGDVCLLYPDDIIHLRRNTGAPSIIRRFRKSDMELLQTLNLSSVDGMDVARQRRMVYDESGKIYILQYRDTAPLVAQVVEMDSDLNLVSINDVEGASDVNEIAIAPSPINRIYVSTAGNTHSYDMSYNLVDTLPGPGNMQNRGRFLNAHPGRAAIKFKVLGLTKQF